MNLTRRSLLAGALAAAATATMPSMSTARPLTKPAIYLIPHQDDEVLTFGSSIKIHVDAGRDVKLVLFGQGETSVREGKMPDLVGYTPTLEQMGWVRDREFTLTAERFQVLPQNVYLWNRGRRLPERSPEWSVAACKTKIREILDMHPDADFKANSPYETNPDHANIGLALRSMWRNGELPNEPRFYLSPWERGQVNHPRLRRELYQGWLHGKRMQRWYRHQDLPNDYWGVGALSVGSYFAAHRADWSSWMHTD